MEEDWVTDEFGDRRQEIVFIGVGYDEGRINEALDGALLDDKEMDEYRRELGRFRVETLEGRGASLFREDTGNIN